VAATNFVLVSARRTPPSRRRCLVSGRLTSQRSPRPCGKTPLPVSAQKFIFPLLLFGFGILVSLWPFHTWAPLGYGSAPTTTAMLHAGVLKKFGL